MLHKTKLTPKLIRRCLKIPGRYRDSEVPGILFAVTPAKNGGNNASWTLRYEVNGRERWLGLGSYNVVSVAQARRRARKARLKLLDGIDPMIAKRAAKYGAATQAYEQHP
jgi:hypothetical protein